MRQAIGYYFQNNDRRLFGALALIGAGTPAVWMIVDVLLQLGHWEYALDDVYIHLAMSEQVARGGYGVNAGEPASASSSILYSYLLAPFAGFDWHWLVPLGLGQVALWVSALILGGILAQAVPAEPGPWRWTMFGMALAGPLLMHWPGMSVLGMEHIIHVLVTLMVLTGLLRLFRDGGLSWLLVAGIVLNPLVRFEGLGLSLLALGVMLMRGQARAAVWIALATALPLGAHFWHMSQLGLDFLPNSVQSKSVILRGEPGETGGLVVRVMSIWASLQKNVASPGGYALAGMSLAWVVFLAAARAAIPRNYRLLGLVALGTLLGHLVLGSTAFPYRYEIYAISFSAVAGIVVLSRWQPPFAILQPAMPLMYFMGLGYLLLHHLLSSLLVFGSGGVAIDAQQRQMARFVDNHWQAPVAVNDLGHVAYRNPHYVLDLWGLANSDALKARLSGADPVWVDRLTREKGVELAMIYDHWLGDDMPPHWSKVAELWVTVPRTTLGGVRVDILAGTPDAANRARQALRDFEPTLPPSAELRLKPDTWVEP